MRKELVVAALFFFSGLVLGIALDRLWIMRTLPAIARTSPAQRPRGAALDQFNTTHLTAPRDEILRGGPAKDGIPSITDPHTVPVGDATFLRDDDRVVGVTINSASRAYPLTVLSQHEAVNDTVGGVPIAVIYCPLCDSVSVVNRKIADRTLEFGISGLLLNSNVLLYDRIDNALWSQVKLEAISGPNAGQSLTHLRFDLTTFSRWKNDHPDATVMSFKTGYAGRDYRVNSYEQRGYFKTDRLWFPVSHQDKRLKIKEPVVGVRLGEVARAYPLAAIAAEPQHQITDTLGGQTLLLRTDESGKTATVVEAPAQAQVVHTFWFAWAAFHPETQVYGVAVDDDKP